MNNTELKVPIKRYKQLIFLFGLTTIVIGILILSIPIIAIKNSNFQFQQEFVGYFVLFPFLFMYSMWLTFGYEKIIIKNKTIELLKSNRIITRINSFSITDIKSIEIVEKSFKSDKWIDIQRERIREKKRAILFWTNMGQLKIISKDGNNKTFFNGLSISEALIIKDKILKEIEKRKHNKA